MKTTTLVCSRLRTWLLLALLLATWPGYVWAQSSWQWAKSVNVYAGPNAPAPNGDAYLAGAIDLYADFAPLARVNNGSGMHDNATGFIARLDAASQQWRWALPFQGLVYKITAAADGGAMVVGEFHTSITLGSFTLQSTGNHSLFVAHCSSSGQWLWATAAPVNGSFGNGPVMGFAQMTTDITPDGNVAVAGVFTGTIAFGSQPALTATVGRAYFVARLDGQTGQWQWATQAAITTPAGTSGANAINGIAQTPTDDVVVTGSLTGVGNFGTLPTLSSPNAAIASLVVACVGGATGNWQWAVQATHAGAGKGAALALTHTGQVVVAGEINGPVSFGTLPGLPGTGGKLTVSGLDGGTGQWQWATQTGGAAISPTTLAITSGDDIVVGGTVSGVLQLSGLPAESFLGLGSFVAKMAAQGGPWRWQAMAKPIIAPAGFVWNFAAVGHLSLSAADEPLVSGGMSLLVYFGPNILLASENVPNGIPDYRSGAFIAKLGTTPLATTSPTLAAQTRLYPNPARNSFTLHLPVTPATTVSATLLNSLGQVVRQQAIPAHMPEVVVDVRGLAPGLYTLLLPLGPETVSRRVVVQ